MRRDGGLTGIPQLINYSEVRVCQKVQERVGIKKGVRKTNSV